MLTSSGLRVPRREATLPLSRHAPRCRQRKQHGPARRCSRWISSSRSRSRFSGRGSGPRRSLEAQSRTGAEMSRGHLGMRCRRGMNGSETTSHRSAPRRLACRSPRGAPRGRTRAESRTIGTPRTLEAQRRARLP